MMGNSRDVARTDAADTVRWNNGPLFALFRSALYSIRAVEIVQWRKGGSSSWSERDSMGMELRGYYMWGAVRADLLFLVVRGWSWPLVQREEL